MLEKVSQQAIVSGISEAALATFNTRVQALAKQRPDLTDNSKFQALMARHKLAPFFSFAIQSEDDLEIIYRFAQTHPITCSVYMVPKLTEKILQIEEIALPGKEQKLSQELAQEILALIHQFFLAYAQLSSGKEQTGQKFDWEDFAAQSIHALNDLIEFIALPQSQLHLYKIHRIEQINQALNNYLAHAVSADSATIRFDLVRPALEVLLLIDLLSFNPGEYEKLAMDFYKRFSDMSEKATETTGDTEQQLALIAQVFDCLVAAGELDNESIYADIGCGDGQRILKPSLNSLQAKHSIKPLTLAADLMPPAANEDWVPVQGNFAHPQFVDRIRQELQAQGRPEQKIQVMTLSWSPINDLHKVEQLQAFRNFSEVMADGGYLILDVPVGYQEEIAAAKQADPTQPYGKISVTFPSEAGELEKPFTINPIRDYILFGLQAGFQVINLTENRQVQGAVTEKWPAVYYKTKSGKDRALLVFQKTTDISPPLAEKILKEKMKPLP